MSPDEPAHEGDLIRAAREGSDTAFVAGNAPSCGEVAANLMGRSRDVVRLTVTLGRRGDH